MSKLFGDYMDAGKNAPELVNVLIEIPMGSDVKYEYDKKNNIIKVDRFLYTSMSYPFNYGYVPATLEEDGDPVDIMVLSQKSVVPGSLMEAKPIGVLLMEDEAGVDSKLIAVPKEKVDPIYGKLNDVEDIDEITKKKIKHFFERYKELEPGKWVKITGWDNAEKAKNIILEAIKRYKQD